ncbi:MAG: flagellar hook-associated protein FlgK [FCB group bacterium]|nr:flagellar hook-associated protein FlgK [FCB group bacterium]
MNNIFSLLEVGKRAVQTNRLQMQVIGHNIANADTEGYSRQRANQKAASAMDMPGLGQAGTGVMIQEITRARDILLDRQVRNEKSALGRWEGQDDLLNSIQNIFTEPSELGFGNVLDEFWSAWGDIANDPEDIGGRSVLRQRAVMLCQNLNDYDSDIKMLQENANAEVISLKNNLNQYAAQIADLNKKIQIAENSGQNANDLRDQRDLLLDNLSEIIKVKISDNNDGTVNIYLGGEIFIQGGEYRTLTTKLSSINGVVIDELVWDGTYNNVVVDGGRLKGIMQFRDVDAIDIRNRLDDFADTLVNNVNGLHQGGYGLNGSMGISFFRSDTTGAGGIEVNPNILNDLNNIAAGGSEAPGDNENALAIAALADAKLMNGGTQTLNEHYAATVSEVGARKESSGLYREQSEAVHLQMVNDRSAVSGVPLDEEMADLIKFQQSFNAAAILVSTANELMTTIINLGK